MRTVLKIAGVVLGLALSTAAAANDWDDSGFFGSVDQVNGFQTKTSPSNTSPDGNKWTASGTNFVKGCQRGQTPSSDKCGDPRFAKEETEADKWQGLLIGTDCGLYSASGCETAYTAAFAGTHAAGYSGWVNGVLKNTSLATRDEAILTAPGMCGLSSAGTPASVCDSTVESTNCGLAAAGTNCRTLFLQFCTARACI